jgi:hypothetical protein
VKLRDGSEEGGHTGEEDRVVWLTQRRLRARTGLSTYPSQEGGGPGDHGQSKHSKTKHKKQQNKEVKKSNWLKIN